MRLSAILLTTAQEAVQELRTAVAKEDLYLPHGHVMLDTALKQALMANAKGYRNHASVADMRPTKGDKTRTKLASVEYRISGIGAYIISAVVGQQVFVQTKTKRRAAGVGIIGYAALELSPLCKAITNYGATSSIFENWETTYKEAFRVMQDWREFLKEPPVSKSPNIDITINQTQDFDNMFSAVAYAGFTD